MTKLSFCLMVLLSIFSRLYASSEFHRMRGQNFQNLDRVPRIIQDFGKRPEYVASKMDFNAKAYYEAYFRCFTEATKALSERERAKLVKPPLLDHPPFWHQDDVDHLDYTFLFFDKNEDGKWAKGFYVFTKERAYYAALPKLEETKHRTHYLELDVRHVRPQRASSFEYVVINEWETPKGWPEEGWVNRIAYSPPSRDAKAGRIRLQEETNGALRVLAQNFAETIERYVKNVSAGTLSGRRLRRALRDHCAIDGLEDLIDGRTRFKRFAENLIDKVVDTPTSYEHEFKTFKNLLGSLTRNSTKKEFEDHVRRCDPDCNGVWPSLLIAEATKISIDDKFELWDKIHTRLKNEWLEEWRSAILEHGVAHLSPNASKADLAKFIDDKDIDSESLERLAFKVLDSNLSTADKWELWKGILAKPRAPLAAVAYAFDEQASTLDELSPKRELAALISDPHTPPSTLSVLASKVFVARLSSGDKADLWKLLSLRTDASPRALGWLHTAVRGSLSKSKGQKIEEPVKAVIETLLSLSKEEASTAALDVGTDILREFTRSQLDWGIKDWNRDLSKIISRRQLSDKALASVTELLLARPSGELSLENSRELLGAIVAHDNFDRLAIGQFVAALGTGRFSSGLKETELLEAMDGFLKFLRGRRRREVEGIVRPLVLRYATR